MLREVAEDPQSPIEFRNEIDFYFKRAYLDERIVEGEDLPELLNAPPMLNTDVFVAVANEDDLNDFSTVAATGDAANEPTQELNILDRKLKAKNKNLS